MPSPPQPTRPAPPAILPPGAARARIGEGLFSDRNLERLSILLDSAFQVPGTRIRFGIDGLIGLVPIAGDALGGLLSALIVIGAWARGAPPVLLARMVVNLAIDVGIGIVPLLGDAFDIAWKANRRNYACSSATLPRRAATRPATGASCCCWRRLCWRFSRCRWCCSATRWPGSRAPTEPRYNRSRVGA